MDRKRIVVGTNSLTESQYPAYTNHCQLWFRFGRSYPEFDFIFVNPARMSIDRMRNMAAKVAIENNADYLLFLDDDVIVDPTVGLRGLLECDADIAAGNVVIRGYPFQYMVFKNNFVSSKLEGESLSLLTECGEGIENVDAVGFSFCLIRVDLLKRLSDPWFITGPNFTEDVYFCVKARKNFPDTTIRINWDCVCGHILWPEIMDKTNRDAYKRYFEEINPGMAEGQNKIRIFNQIVPYDILVKRDLANMRVGGVLA